MAKKRRNNIKQFVLDAKLDSTDPYKKAVCPQCGMPFNQGGGQGPGKAYCSRRCFTRHRKDNRVK